MTASEILNTACGPEALRLIPRRAGHSRGPWRNLCRAGASSPCRDGSVARLGGAGGRQKKLGFTRVDDVGFCWGFRRFPRGNLHGFRGVNGGLGDKEIALQLEAPAGLVGMAELVDFAAEGTEGAKLGTAEGIGVAIPAGYG
jgi:hypothetical protein